MLVSLNQFLLISSKCYFQWIDSLAYTTVNILGSVSFFLMFFFKSLLFITKATFIWAELQ